MTPRIMEPSRKHFSYFMLLSDELILEILEWLYAMMERYSEISVKYGSFYSLALTNKRLAGLSREFLFRVLDNSGRTIPNVDQFVDRILQDTTLASLVKVVDWNCDQKSRLTMRGSMDSLPERSTPESSGNSDLQEEHHGSDFGEDEFLPEDEDQEELLADILGKTTKIRSLHVVDKHYDDDGQRSDPNCSLDDLPTWIDLLSKSPVALAPSITHTFSNLTFLTIKMIQMGLKDLGGILKLPVLKALHLSTVYHTTNDFQFRDPSQEFHVCKPRESNIRTLRLVDCMIPTKAMSKLLSYFSGLNTFDIRYSENQHDHWLDRMWSTHKIKLFHPTLATALAQHSDTLQLVRLEESYEDAKPEELAEIHQYDDQWVSSLQALVNVRELLIGFRAFASTTPEPPLLSTSLPPNLEKLKIYIEDEHDILYFKEAVTKLAQGCRQHLPKLKEVHICVYLWVGKHTWRRKDKVALVKLFEEQGVKLEMTRDYPTEVYLGMEDNMEEMEDNVEDSMEEMEDNVEEMEVSDVNYGTDD